MSKSRSNSIEDGIWQIIIWVILLILIIIRFTDDSILPANWIWIINYIGMCVAFLNLFIEKCNKLRDKNHKNFKPFLGLTILISIAVCILGVGVGMLQSTKNKDCINDVITLLSVFFSLSKNIWDSILNWVVKHLKK